MHLKKDSQVAVHIMSMLPTMNTLSVEEGRLPKKADECAVDAEFLAGSGYKIGDEIQISSGNEDAITETLTTDTFTIVGAVSSPCYISFGRGSTNIGTGSISGFIAVPEESFKLDVYTELYAVVDGAKELTAFTDAYESRIEETINQVDTIKSERQKARKQEVVDAAEAELVKGQNELADAKKEAEEELADAKTQLDTGWKQLNDGKTALQRQSQKWRWRGRI